MVAFSASTLACCWSTACCVPRPFLHQVLEAREVLGVGDELRLVLRLLGLGLIERGLERSWVDDREHVARLDPLSLDKVHALQLAVHLAMDRDRVGGLHRAEALEINRYVLRPDLGDGDRYRRRLLRCRSGRRLLLRLTINHQGNAYAENHKPDEPGKCASLAPWLNRVISLAELIIDNQANRPFELGRQASFRSA